MDNYNEQLRRILELTIGLRDDRFGYAEAEIDEAEQRLGVRLPQALRAMYRYVGRHPLWREAHHRLVEPAKLAIEEGRLVFLLEVQNVVQMLLLADDLGLGDPPVYQFQPADPEQLYKERSALALYLLESMCWELVCIGEDLEENAEGLEMWFGETMPHADAQKEVAGMTRVALGDGDDAWTDGAYYKERAVACVFVGDDTTSIYSWNAIFDEE